MTLKKTSTEQPTELYRELDSGRTAKFDEKLAHLLACSARAFAVQGYEEASIRHVSKAAGFSLAGVYHYVSGKEDLLFLIQYHTFGALVEELEKIIASQADPLEQIRGMILSHVKYLSEHLPEIKVCTIELETLQGDHYRQVLNRRQRYFELTRSILVRLRDEDQGSMVEPGLAALYLFGMLNWIVMWFDPKRNDTSDLSESLADLFLGGYRKAPAKSVRPRQDGGAAKRAKQKVTR